MYEGQNETIILERMLGNMADNVDKREGSIAFDAAMPAAIEFMLLYASIDYFYKNSFGDTAERPWLIQIAKERGLAPYPATFMVGKVLTTPKELDVPVGARFSYDDVNYVLIEKLEEGTYLAQCEQAGTVGNKPQGMLVPIDFVTGLRTAQLVEITVPGEDEEETEAFRTRYLNSFNSQAFGGNIADYREKVNAIDGVGGVKIYPTWKGGGTVRVVFMTSQFMPPTPEFVDKVQTLLDPVPNSGQGLGIAPIGHHVTVQGAQNSAISISFKISFDSGGFEEHKEAIYEIIDKYFRELNSKWEKTQMVNEYVFNNNGIIVRTSQIESRLLELPEVADIEHTKLNGVEENLVLGPDQLAVRGAVSNG